MEDVVSVDFGVFEDVDADVVEDVVFGVNEDVVFEGVGWVLVGVVVGLTGQVPLPLVRLASGVVCVNLR